MYEKALKLTAKQKVALEVLSYHASSSLDETKKLMVIRTYFKYSQEFRNIFEFSINSSFFYILNKI